MATDLGSEFEQYRVPARIRGDSGESGLPKKAAFCFLTQSLTRALRSGCTSVARLRAGSPGALLCDWSQPGLPLEAYN